MNNLKTAAFRLAILFSIASRVFADEEAEFVSFYGDEEFVSIATGVSLPISKAPAVASVITKADIKKIGATDIDQILETIPGLHVAKNAVAYAPIYVFRGVYTESNPQVLMLIDGVPLTNLYLGDRNLAWGGMPVESISRVEIIRGPGSAIYGADAFAGVINIITIDPASASGIDIGARTGSFATKDIWLTYGKKWQRSEIAASIEIHDSDGQSEDITSDAQTLLDAISSTNASLAPNSVNLHRKNADARLHFRHNNVTIKAGAQLRRDNGVGAGVAQALDNNGEVSSKRYNLNLVYEDNEISTNLGIKAVLSHLQTSQEIEKNIVLFPPGSRGPFFNQIGAPIFSPFPNGIIGNPEVFERHSRANLAITYRGWATHEFLFGSGYYSGEVYKTEEEKNFGIDPNTGLPILPGSDLVNVSDTPLVFLPEDDRENRYIFIQDVWHFANDWELTAGIRYDHYSDFGDTVNPRLALVWSTRHNLTTKLLYGEAFRAPSFAETRVQSNPTVLGNLSLKPETLKSYEIAFNYKPTFDITLDLNLFHYRWSNIIQFVPDNNGSTRTAQNTGEQKGHGIEFEANWNVNDTVSVLANYSWQASDDKRNNADAANAPEQQFYVRAMATLPGNTDLNIQMNSVMDRNRAAGDPRNDIDDYTTVNLTLRKRFHGDKLELSLLAKNIFDEDAREPSLNADPVPFIPEDLPLAGRQLLGEVRYNF